MVLTFAFANASVCFCLFVNRGNVFMAISFYLTLRNIQSKDTTQKALAAELALLERLRVPR